MTVRILSRLSVCLLVSALASCMVGPDYQRPPPASPPPARYKELSGWVVAAPADAAPKGDWWTDFEDPLLDELEPQVEISNQTVRAAYENYQQALALVREARATLFPTLALTGSVSRLHGGGFAASTSGLGVGGTTAGAASGRPNVISTASLEGTVSWDLDIWGKVRRTIEANEANAQASQATFANAKLAAQVTLATSLINLRATDAQMDLLTKTVEAYKEYVRVISNAVNAGYNLYPPSDEFIARTQLENAQASLVALGIARAQYAHAIAVLVGKNPSDFEIPRSDRLPKLPKVPVSVPSTLLQRRPDIAAAERTMAAQNAGIGVAIAAYYPDISLSAADGFSQEPLGGLFRAANNVWSIGADGAETLFDFGAREAGVDAARAAYRSAVASYRATVLNAFQGVEDTLAGLRVLGQQSEALGAAVRDAARSAEIAHNEYQAGIVDYTTVATAETTLLTDQQNALSVEQNRLIDAATLIGDLGGNWSDAELGTGDETKR